MTSQDLLSIVQPDGGWFAVLGIKGEDDVRQKLVQTREEVDTWAERFVKDERNVYFGVAKFLTNANRKKPNVQALKAFWLDIDCGEAKTKISPTTGRPDGYATQQEGMQALMAFAKKLKLPKPTIVDSGRGWHVYWPLTYEIPSFKWEPVAEKFRDLCIEHELYVDPKVFEVARVLRLPGTYNFKDTPPTPVQLMSVSKPVDFVAFHTLLGVESTPDTGPELDKATKPKRELSELAKSMMQNTTSSFAKILRDGKCSQINKAYENRHSLSEPLWFSILSIAKHCSDRDTAIHTVSEGHPDYSPKETERKIIHIAGPHSCKQFEENCAGGCDGCPFKGKITSPIQLGKEVLEATEEDNTVVVEPEDVGGEAEVHTIPEYPFPFFRGKNGGIYKNMGDEEEPALVYEHDLYVVKRMRDPLVGDVVVMKLHLPQDGVKKFVVSNIQIMDGTELRKALASHGVVCGQKQYLMLVDFILRSIKELQFVRSAETMRQQFGWADKDSKFIIGDREITPDGVFHSPPSTVTAPIAEHMQMKGTLEKWKEVFSLYGRPGLEPHAFATLTAFGSPLLKFLGQNGAIINVIHPKSGTGKTTILHMCNSVYGDPSRLCSTWQDTMHSKILRLGVMNNLPYTVDEITNLTANDFSTLAYSMSQGRGRDRVKASANELRINLTTWQCISLCSSNASFYEKLAAIKSSPDGEMMRLLEYKIDYNGAIEASYAKSMFDHQLQENYGHAGDIYVKWLVDNLEEAKLAVLGVQAKIDKELKLTQRERFWSAVAAANIAGGLIAKNLGLIDWDMKGIYTWVTNMISDLRGEVKPPASDAMTVLGDYINRHMQNILVVNDKTDRRTNMQMMPVLEPRGELLIRYEPDTKKMFIAAKPFKNDCVEYQTNYKDTLHQLEKKGVYLGSVNKRLSKGMKIVSPGVHSLVFNCESSEFLDMESLVPLEDNTTEEAIVEAEANAN